MEGREEEGAKVCAGGLRGDDVETEAERKEVAEWNFSDWKKAIERDQAPIEAFRQRLESLLSLHLVAHGKVLDLLRSQACEQDDLGLPFDLDAVEAAIRGILGECDSQPDN